MPAIQTELQETSAPARQDLQRRDWQLAQVLAAANAFQFNPNLERRLEEIVQGAQRVWGAGAAALFLLDQDGQHLRVRAHAGLDEARRQGLEGAVHSWQPVADLLQDRFRVGASYCLPPHLGSDPGLPGVLRSMLSTRPAAEQRDAVNQTSPGLLLIPIRPRQGQMGGMIALDAPADRGQPDQATLHILEILASLAALAIENAQLYEQAQQQRAGRQQAEQALRQLNETLEKRVAERSAELLRLNAELTREVNEHRQAEVELLQRNRELLSLQSAAIATTYSLDLHFVLDTVTWELASLLGVDGCAISEWNREADTLTVIAQHGSVPWDEEQLAVEVYKLADYALRQQILTERSAQQLVISQADIDHAEREHMQAAHYQSLLMLPMIFQDRVVGLVELSDSQIERVFTDHEISLAQLLANQAASAVENARLYQRAQQEIAERMRAEEQIKLSLKEKELLLKEIHHRVKNNLQVISSLLNLQAKSIQDASALEMFRESQNRVRSMALIHEKLYRSDDLARIDFGEYVRNLAAFLVRSYRSNAGPVVLNVNAQGVYLGIDAAVPCGLIINELVSNALKHAFPPGREDTSPDTAGPMQPDHEIRVELRHESDALLTLVVADNGVGLPPDLDLRNTQSLGMQLVNTLVQQLKGSLDIDGRDGACFKITFPVA